MALGTESRGSGSYPSGEMEHLPATLVSCEGEAWTGGYRRGLSGKPSEDFQIPCGAWFQGVEETLTTVSFAGTYKLEMSSSKAQWRAGTATTSSSTAQPLCGHRPLCDLFPLSGTQWLGRGGL